MTHRPGHWLLAALACLAVGCVLSPEAVRDAGLFLEREDLAQHGIELAVDSLQRSSRRVVFFDGSFILEYSLAGTGAEGEEISIDISAHYESSASMAMDHFADLHDGWQAVNGDGDGDGPVQFIDHFFRFGDESFFAFLMNGEETAGNLFVCRLGRQVYYLIINGAYCGDPSAWAALLGPKLDFWSMYEPIPGRANPPVPRDTPRNNAPRRPAAGTLSV